MTQTNIKIPKNFFEKKAWENGQSTCGIDEVGRGCLAGPVVVGAVIIPSNTTYRLLKDSKILEEEDREKAYAWITEKCLWSTATVSHRLIDSLNIYQATLRAMKLAYLQLVNQTTTQQFKQLKYVLIDAMPLDLSQTYGHPDLEFHHSNYGETWSASIAAASIVAKVTRDRLMKRLDSQFPAFAFAQHKGYATKQHIQALLAQGPTCIHRTSFIGQIVSSDAPLGEGVGGNGPHQYPIQHNIFDCQP